MKLVMTLLVKNECDIIRQNIEFHLSSGVDYIIAIDNGSRDGTRDILVDYERRGIATVIDEPRQNYAQSEWVTAAALRARDEFDADWILNNDADEFWLGPSGDLKQDILSAATGKLICERRNMLYAWDDEDSGNWIDKARYRVAEPVSFTKPRDIFENSLPAPYLYLGLPSKMLLSAQGLKSVSQGNHDGSYETSMKGSKSSIRIYHYPLRSKTQFREKVMQGAEAYARNKELPPGMGWHWRRWYHLLQIQDLDTMLSDVLPSSEKLRRDRESGIIVEDNTMRSYLMSLTA
jgi:glycosyltransferase involved in cell wall biosynthesis